MKLCLTICSLFQSMDSLDIPSNNVTCELGTPRFLECRVLETVFLKDIFSNRHFLERHYLERTFCRSRFLERHFPKWKFSRKDIFSNGQNFEKKYFPVTKLGKTRCLDCELIENLYNIFLLQNWKKTRFVNV